VSFQLWKDYVADSFQRPLRMPIQPTSKPQIAPAITPAAIGRQDMIRKTLFAVAASLMTVSAFSGTIGIMGAQQGGASVQVA
jgi:hypothetical protein